MSEQPNRAEQDAASGELPALRGRLLIAMLRHAPFDGWGERALAAAARDEGVTPELAAIAFQGGPAEIADFFQIDADRRMVAAVETALAEAAAAAEAGAARLKLRDKVALAVRTRLIQQGPHREALRALTAFLATPAHAGQAARGLWRTVDALWRVIGDRSTDFTYYSKRAMLAGVYGSTVLVWLDDASEGFADTFAFLDRRIADVMAIEACKARLRENWTGLFRRTAGLRGRPPAGFTGQARPPRDASPG